MKTEGPTLETEVQSLARGLRSFRWARYLAIVALAVLLPLACNRGDLSVTDLPPESEPPNSEMTSLVSSIPLRAAADRANRCFPDSTTSGPASTSSTPTNRREITSTNSTPIPPVAVSPWVTTTTTARSMFF